MDLLKHVDMILGNFDTSPHGDWFFKKSPSSHLSLRFAHSPKWQSYMYISPTLLPIHLTSATLNNENKSYLKSSN